MGRRNLNGVFGANRPISVRLTVEDKAILHALRQVWVDCGSDSAVIRKALVIAGRLAKGKP